MTWLLLLAVVVIVYVAFLLALFVSGRHMELRAWAGLIPDCLILFRRLLGDGRISRRRKAVLGLLLLYLATPIDLVPDFVPVIGLLDDAVFVALALRYVLRDAGPEVVREFWPGPPRTLALVMRLSGGATDA